MTPIAIPDPIRKELYAHALAVFPAECCGYLVGRAPDSVDEAIACNNAQASGEHPLTPERTEETGFGLNKAPEISDSEAGHDHQRTGDIGL